MGIIFSLKLRLGNIDIFVVYFSILLNGVDRVEVVLVL